MTVAFYCLFAGLFLPYVWATTSAVARGKQLGHVDNKHPRQQQAQLSGWGARANAAQMNAFEALAVFGPTVIATQVAGADPVWCGRLAVGWLAARSLHGVAYVANIDKLRSGLFMLALGCAAAMWVVAIVH